MSELKTINAYRLTTNTEDSDVYIHNDEFGCGGDLVECYLKSEADKVIVERDAEIRRLKRALYKACANWADVEVFERTVGIDDPNVEANRWALMRNKCLKKVEEYK